MALLKRATAGDVLTPDGDQISSVVGLEVGAQLGGGQAGLVQTALGPVSAPGRLAEGQEQYRWTLLSGVGHHFALPFAGELAELRVHLIHLPFPLTVAAPARAAL
jgi:hypothetical protein